MTLNACSTTVHVPIKNPILCPTATKCGQFQPQIRTNADLVQNLQQGLNMLDFCVAENQALKDCITEHNKDAMATLETEQKK